MFYIFFYDLCPYASVYVCVNRGCFSSSLHHKTHIIAVYIYYMHVVEVKMFPPVSDNT